MITATILLAHDLFLKLDSYFVPPNTAVRVAVLNGSFSSSDAAVTPDRLRDLSMVGPLQRRSIPHDSWKPAGDTTWLTVQTGIAGTYVIGASLSPRQIALAAADFNNYLKEDGIPTCSTRGRATASLVARSANATRSTSRRFSRSAICGRTRSNSLWGIRRSSCR